MEWKHTAYEQELYITSVLWLPGIKEGYFTFTLVNHHALDLPDREIAQVLNWFPSFVQENDGLQKII